MNKWTFGIVFLGALVLFSCSRRPVHMRTDDSTPLTNSPPIHLDAAIARAKTENKLVFLDFTGSDWCPPCMQLHKEVFSQPEFQEYAASNLVFLTVDFPSKFHLSSEAGATNDFLAGKFGVEAFPTLLALDGDGKEVWRQVGFMGGGPKRLISMVEAFKARAR